MSVKLRHNSLLSQRTSTQCSAENWPKVHYLCNGDLNYIRCDRKHARKRSFIICAGSGRSKYRHIYTSSQSLKHQLVSNKSKKGGNHLLFASADDRVAVNGTAQGTSSSNVEAMRVKLDQSLQNEDYNNGLLQSLHDAARVFELSIKQSSLFKMSWFSAAWLGVDKNTWVKALSYQSAVYSLLQAANEISSCADGRERDVNAVLQRSLLRLSAPLESIVREKLSVKQPELFQWFWYEQVPVVVTTFVNHFERDPRFKAATVSGKRTSFGDNESDASLLMLSLACAAAISKLGPAKVSCSQFFTMIPEITGKLMDMLVDLVPIAEAYQSVKEIGLHREFLVHFGPRAASAWVNDDCGTDETVFWVDLVQKQLQLAIDREKIWSRLTTFESIEVLERDLAIFGFFIALGRSTKSFLIANGFENIDEPIEGFIRYLIGGSVLYYPQLSSISSYQLYVEVVCEELDWLPFYPGYTNSLKGSHGHKGDIKSPPNVEAIPRALDVCSHWIQSLIKHSKWLRNPSNVKAARFLSKGHNKLRECKEVLGAIKKELVEDRDNNADGRTKHNSNLLFKEEPGSFEKALESVEEALLKLEKLLQELHVSSSKSEKNHLKAACSDLERIRKLKKEAEFLEASFRAKAASLQQGNDDLQSPSFANQQKKYVKHRNGGGVEQDRNNRDLRSSVGLWGFLFWPPTKETENGFSKALEKTDRGSPDPTLSCLDAGKSDSNEFHRFEILRSELMELEKRVKKSTNQPENVGDVMECPVEVGGTGLVTVQKNGNLIEKSFDKLKETTTDVWQGSQLLAIDVACAMGLLRRLLIGDELTEKEKNALRRTLTDLASVVPIGVLMLLPVTAVGHAAMLAAIQRYVPGLIPSTYGPERLYLLRQLEKMKEIEASDSDENVEEST